MLSARHTQDGALTVQMSNIGLNCDESSRDGNRIDMTSGAASPWVKSGEPHSAQKLRVTVRPLPARTKKLLGVPVTATSDALTMMPEAKGAPLERWQSRQWQFSIATGAPEQT
jgi:hypothetical protein